MSATKKRAIKTTTKRSATSLDVPEEIRVLASEFYADNKASNDLAAKARATRKDLFRSMKRAGLKAFKLHTSIGGKSLLLDVSLVTPTRQVVDVEALRKLVDADTFARIVEASQVKVKAEVGEAILQQVLTPQEGKEDVVVKPAK